MKADVYTIKGTKASSVELDEFVFDAPYNQDLIHQVVVSMQANARQGSAHSKTRGEVRGGGKKPWRQKGTGRARHGSSRSPIWVGGGTTFGPRNDKDYSKKINRKVKIKALYAILSEKFRSTQVMLVEDFGIQAIATKSVQDIIKNISGVSGFETLDTKKNPNNILIVVPEYNEMLLKSINNMPHVMLADALGLNVMDVIQHRYVVVMQPELVNSILASRHWSKETLTPTAVSDAPKTKKVAKKEEQKVAKKVAQKKAGEKKTEKKAEKKVVKKVEKKPAKKASAK